MEKIVCGLLCSIEEDALCKISFENLIGISVKSGENFSNVSSQFNLFVLCFKTKNTSTYLKKKIF